TVEDGVFLGPGVVLTNDRTPRAINPDGSLKTSGDWQVGPIRVCYGASIGAGVIVLPNITVGRFAMVGAGAVVTRHVPDHAIVFGVPAHLVGYACRCGLELKESIEQGRSVWTCPKDGERYEF
ncbi:MAG: acyltransferase, partial [Anaerolineae bacterium]